MSTMIGNTITLISISIIIVLASLLPSSLCEPSKLGKATLACLEDGLAAQFAEEKPPSEVYKTSVAEKNKELSKSWKFTAKKIVPRMFQTEHKNDENGVPRFDTITVTQGKSKTVLHDTDIMKATSQCPGDLHPEQAFTCATRILSQADIKGRPFTGLLNFIASITPQKPICVEEIVRSTSFKEEYRPDVTPVKSRLTDMQDLFRQCVAEVTENQLLKANHPEIAEHMKVVGGTREAAAAEFMLAGERAFFGCNWFVRRYNIVINKTSQLTDIVKKEWITDCMRKGLPKIPGINVQQFNEAYGATDDPEKVEQLNYMLTGIRCAPPSIDAALDIDTELRIFGGPAWQKAKHIYDNLKEYITCFKAEYKNAKPSGLGELIGCNENAPGLYQKTQKCAAEAAKSKTGEFKLVFPASGAEMKKLMATTTMTKSLYSHLCRFAVQIKSNERQTREANAHGMARQTRGAPNEKEELIFKLLVVVLLFCVLFCMWGAFAFLAWLVIYKSVWWGLLAIVGGAMVVASVARDSK